MLVPTSFNRSRRCGCGVCHIFLFYIVNEFSQQDKDEHLHIGKCYNKMGISCMIHTFYFDANLVPPVLNFSGNCLTIHSENTSAMTRISSFILSKATISAS